MRLFPLFTVLVTVSVFCALAVPCASSSADTCSSGGGPDGTTCSASSGGSTSVPQLDILQDESVARLKELEQTSDSEGSLARTFMSPAFVKAQDMISDWLRDAGFTKARFSQVYVTGFEFSSPSPSSP